MLSDFSKRVEPEIGCVIMEMPNTTLTLQDDLDDRASVWPRRYYTQQQICNILKWLVFVVFEL
jgi:hypothetical protein